MNRALVFPGQGSQSVGMGHALAGAFAEARDVLQEVDDALGQHLTRLMFEGPENDLKLTENAQPALMAVSLAVIRVLDKQGNFRLPPAAKFVAGHSLGEYSALCAAESFTLAANDNAPGQVVISGHVGAIDRAIAIAAERGFKRSIKLPVSAPFHCSLMQPAADAMQKALADVKIRPPTMPLIANVTAEAVSDAGRIRDLLIKQITAPVRWRESVLYMKGHGIGQLVECGAGSVLASLAKRIDKDITAVSLHTPEEIEEFLKSRDG